MTQTVHLLSGGIVVNSITVDSAATVFANSISLPNGGTFAPPAGDTFMVHDGAGVGWTLSAGVLIEPAVAPPALATIIAHAMEAVSKAASAVVSNVVPDAAHQAAFQNAASILNGNGGAAPTTGALATAFAALATAYGVSSASFATLVLEVQAASLTLAAAVATFNTVAVSAKTSDVVATAIGNFETSLVSVVTSLNAVLLAPIAAPSAIVIVGANV